LAFASQGEIIMKIIILLLALCASVVYSQELTYDQKIVAMTIVGEARGEGKLGMYAVGAVIAQRVIAWKKTPAQVCLKKSQFSCWNPNDPNRAKLPKLLNTPEGKYAKHLAVHLRSLNRAHFGYADHYCHVKQNPYWIKGEKTIIVIENHKFYKLM